MEKSHRDVVLRKIKRHRWRRGAELGIGKGHLSKLLLASRPGLTLIGVDHFVKPGGRELVQAIEAEYPDRYIVHACTTREAAPRIPDASLDFVFIDAAHSYAAVVEDIQRWTPKIRPGGWIGGHDYHEAYPGVKQAVNEAFGEAVTLDEAAVWWVRRP